MREIERRKQRTKAKINWELNESKAEAERKAAASLTTEKTILKQMMACAPAGQHAM